nr:hypothetical protein 1 [bacterium]
MTPVKDQARLAVEAARVFSSAEGRRVLHHLRAITRERVLAPDASDAALRHVEGQRALVAHLESLIERGRNPVPPIATQNHEGDFENA